MNKALLKAAAIFNIAAASLIYVSCSGDDGAKGEPGQAGVGCTAAASASVPGGIDITCGGVSAGTLQPGNPGAQGNPGQDGQGVPPSGCYLESTAAGYDVICGGINQGPLVTGSGPGVPGGDGCTVNPGAPGDGYYIFTCPGGSTYEVPKAICGTEAYDPQVYACDLTKDPDSDRIIQTLSREKCGTKALDTLTQFCQDQAKSAVQYFCGPVTDTVRTYTADKFCQPKTPTTASLTAPLTAADTSVTAATAPMGAIKDRCAGEAYAASQFCYNSASVSLKCAASTNNTHPLIAENGSPYERDQLCIDGKVQGACGGLPYEAKTEFCQSGTVKNLCGPEKTTAGADVPLASRQYTATEFCQSQTAGDVNSAADVSLTKNNATKAGAGKIKTYCSVEDNSFTPSRTKPEAFGSEQFCQPSLASAGKAFARIMFLCSYDNLTLAKEYTANQFCQVTGMDDNGDDEKYDGTNAISIALAKAGKVAAKCGSTNKVYGSDQFCGVSLTVVDKVECIKGNGGTDKPLYNPETEFCVIPTAGNDADGTIHPTCIAAAALPAGTTKNEVDQADNELASPAKFYNVSKKVCETGDKVLYDFSKIGTETGLAGGGGSSNVTSKIWLLEDLSIGGASTFTWSDAKAACDTLGGGGWSLPADVDIKFDDDPSTSDGLIKAGGGPGTAGLNLRTATGWGATTNPTAANITNFAAVPATVTGITPAPSGSNAYWWTSGERGWVLTTQSDGSQTWAAGTDYNQGNYFAINGGDIAVARGGSHKLNTKLSVRCVK